MLESCIKWWWISEGFHLSLVFSSLFLSVVQLHFTAACWRGRMWLNFWRLWLHILTHTAILKDYQTASCVWWTRIRGTQSPKSRRSLETLHKWVKKWGWCNVFELCLRCSGYEARVFRYRQSVWIISELKVSGIKWCTVYIITGVGKLLLKCFFFHDPPLNTCFSYKYFLHPLWRKCPK